ncbi:MAG: DUF547 domain-containing protein [Myxococcota bacterium]
MIALLLGVLLGCSAPSPLPPLVVSDDGATAAPFDHTHAAFDALLARHVTAGKVDYDGLAAARPALDAYIASLATPTREQEAAWTREQRIAFWINAYNALALRVVLDHRPIDSIRSIGLLPYAAFREPVATLRARPAPLSLDDIEKGILLGEIGEVRVHFAVNCASTSCPALLSRAWRADDLDATLDAATRAFLADPTKNRWDPATRTLALSRIFEWYAADFQKAAGDVPTFVARYAPPEMAAGIAATNVGAAPIEVTYLDYDWSLNDVSRNPR